MKAARGSESRNSSGDDVDGRHHRDGCVAHPGLCRCGRRDHGVCGEVRSSQSRYACFCAGHRRGRRGAYCSSFEAARGYMKVPGDVVVGRHHGQVDSSERILHLDPCQTSDSRGRLNGSGVSGRQRRLLGPPCMPRLRSS